MQTPQLIRASIQRNAAAASANQSRDTQSALAEASKSENSPVQPASSNVLQQEAKHAPSVLRVTESVALYDVSSKNPNALANLAKALAGSLHRPELTFYDPESKTERQLGDVLVSMDISNSEEIVLQHRNSAGKGALGRLISSIGYMISNPITTIAMKCFGIVADPEKVYLQKVIQTLATLDQNGMFGPPGASTFSIADWDISTRNAWRDVVISKKKEPEPIVLTEVSFSDVLRAYSKMPFV